MLVIALASLAIVGGALSFGGVESWFQPLLAALATALGAVAVTLPGNRSARMALMVLAGLVTLVAVQLSPLPATWIQRLSPQRVALADEFGAGAPDRLTPSYYAPATRRSQAQLLIGAAVFASLAFGIRSTREVKWMLTVLLVVGVAEAVLGLTQLFPDPPASYWETTTGRQFCSGSFVNHSNYSQFENLAFGAGIGLLLIRSGEQRHRRLLKEPRPIAAYLQENWGLLAGMAVILAAIAVSLSRGGAIGALAGGVAVAATIGAQRKLGPVAWALLIVPLLGFAFLTTLGFDAVYERFGTLKESETYADRWRLTAATFDAGRDHLPLGTGFGTHRWVFPVYDNTDVPYLAEQADNDYAQLFEESGLVGVGLVALLLATIITCIWRTISEGRSPAGYANYGVLYSLVACMVQSYTDFGQRLPAVYCASAAMAGLVFATAELSRDGVAPTARRAPWRWAAALGVLVLGGWHTREAWRDHLAARWSETAYGIAGRIEDPDRTPTPTDYADLLFAAEQAQSLRTDDVECAFWLAAYRWDAFTAGVDPVQAVASDDGRQIAERLVQDLAATRRLCPTFGPPHTLAGQIQLYLGEIDDGRRQVEAGVRLTPHDPEAHYAAAIAAAMTNPMDAEQVATRLAEAVTLDGRYFVVAAAVWLDSGATDLAPPISWAGEDPDRLRRLARMLDKRGMAPEQAEELRGEADQRAAERVASGEAPAHQIADLAAAHASKGERSQAVKLYQSALAKEPTNVGWRLALSDVLQEDGQLDEAFRQARWCLRLRPGWAPAVQRLEQLSLKAGIGVGPD